MLTGHLSLRKDRAALLLIIILSLIGCNLGRPVGDSEPETNIHHNSSFTITDDFIEYNHNQAPIIPTQHIHRNDINNKKIYIILTFLGLSVFGAIVLSFMNVHYDYIELQNFYRGYMGRRLLIQEGRLLTRRHEEKVIQNKKKGNSDRKSDRKRDTCNGGAGLLKFDEALSPTSVMDEVFAISPVTTTSLLVPGPSMETGELDLVETSLIEMPSVTLGIPRPRRFVEDDGPEWRELDYLVQIGNPPPTFFLFFQQYDWNIYTGETLSHKDIEERKNLLFQFRKWKKRKRKTFNIVVTERSRREMAEQEEEKNKKRIPPSK